MAFKNDAERIAYEADIARKLKFPAIKTQPKMTTTSKLIALGIGAGFIALVLYANLKTNHPDPVPQVKTEIGTPDKAEAERKAAYEANAKVIAAAVKAEAKAKAKAIDDEKLEKFKKRIAAIDLRPQECIDGGLDKEYCDIWQRAQKRKAEGPTWSGDQFEQNRKDAFAKDGGGN